MIKKILNQPDPVAPFLRTDSFTFVINRAYAHRNLFVYNDLGK